MWDFWKSSLCFALKVVARRGVISLRRSKAESVPSSQKTFVLQTSLLFCLSWVHLPPFSHHTFYFYEGIGDTPVSWWIMVTLESSFSPLLSLVVVVVLHSCFYPAHPYPATSVSRHYVRFSYSLQEHTSVSLTGESKEENKICRLTDS